MVSIKKKLILMSLGISLVVVFLVAFVSGYLINKQHKLLSELIAGKSSNFLKYLQTSSNAAQEALAKESFDSLVTKGQSLVRKDSLALGIALTENSISFAREYITQAVSQDPDIVEGAFYTHNGEHVQVWQLATKHNPSGIPLMSIFDDATSSWKFHGKTVQDQTLKDVLKSKGETVRIIEKDNLKYIDISFEVESSDTGARGYVRYQLTTKHIEKSIRREQDKLAASLQLQNDMEMQSNVQMSATTTDIRQTSFILLLLVVSVSFAIAYGIASRASYRITTPIRKLQDGAEKIAHGQYDLDLSMESNDEIGELARHFNEMRIKVKDFTTNLQELVDQRTKELATSLNKTRAIFDTIEQGIITISCSPAIIDDDMSPYVATIFKEKTSEIASRKFRDFFMNRCNLDPDSKGVIHDIIETCMDTDAITWDANKDKLPREIAMTIDGEIRHIQVEWCPMLDENGIISRFLIAMKDLTVVKRREQELKAEIKAQEEEISKIAAIVANSKDSLLLFVTDVGKRIQKIQEELGPTGTVKGDNKLIFHELHTIKGQARSLKLQEIANESHVAEDMLKESALERSDLKVQISKLAATYEGYVHIMSKKLGWSIEEQVVDFTNLMHKELMIFKATLLANHIPVRHISLHDDVIQWNRDAIADIKAIVTHVINNVIDHGYLQPACEGFQGVGELSISAEWTGKWVTIIVKDAGRGFVLDKIQQKSRKLGIDMSAFKNPLDVVLLPEFSTSSSLTQTSGRGVGMSAVKSIVDSYHGTIEIMNNADGGASIRVALPSIKVIDATVEGGRRDLAS